tara:strand:+ start:922 stop:1410 length:489 start_codon:yes stop_codon:yes gene_type:complete
MPRIKHVNALSNEKMNFSTLGIRSELKDYELAYWLNYNYDLGLIARLDVTDVQINGSIWEYNVYDGTDHNGETLCLVMNVSSGWRPEANETQNLFGSVLPKKHLLTTVKHWDCVLIAENNEFAVDLETALKRNSKITTASYFEAHTQLTQSETHLLYEIRNV